MPVYYGSTPAYHVVCLLLALLVNFSKTNQQGCGEQAVCRGDRPPLLTGCCPVKEGQECRPTNGESCDTELGFSCVTSEGQAVTEGVGTCRGRYNLHVTSRGETTVDLAWSEFASPGYMFEYVLLFKEGSYHYDVSQWTAREIGDRPQYSLNRLSPATLHFIKVAVWEDARSMTIGNTSETIMVETMPVEFCEHQGHHYLVGEPFLHDCEDNCTCLPTGNFRCTPLCPERGLPELEDGCHLTSGDECCDYRITCPVGGEPCEIDGESYPHSAEIELGCRVCTCIHGQLECEYPHTCHVMEPTPSCPSPRRRDVDGECCPEWYCGRTCEYENHTYQDKEYFTSAQCGLCLCDANNGVQCSPDCPPVVMVLPDSTCPDPHVRQDGCCDTLYCDDPTVDVAQFVRSMFAMSFSPVTLTLSFEVDPQSEVSGVPLYCQYEILYANTSEPLVTWQRRLVHPVDVLLHEDQSHHLEPTEALTRETAIVVGRRAYVTLSGMHPNTTYYVKIIPLDGSRQDTAGGHSGHLNYSDSSISAMVVVKTRPLDNVTSCFHSGKEVLHGEAVASHCSQRCFCFLGKISCQSACEAESVVMATSPSCPQPRLEKQEGDCCLSWRCYPSASGCSFGGLILEAGQSTREGCQVCTCQNSSVTCSSVCPPIGQSPRPGCHMTNVSGHCCPQWTCPLESHIPHGVKSSVLIYFSGTCENSVSNFENELGKQVLRHVRNHIGCSNNQPEASSVCRNLYVEVFCDGLPVSISRSKRRRRRTATVTDRDNRIPVLVSFHKNFSSESPDQLAIHEAQSVGLQLVAALNSSFDVILDSGVKMTSSDKAQLQELSYFCNEGFSFLKGTCVLSEIASTLSFRANLQLVTRDITPYSVIIEWPPLGDQLVRQISGLLVEHRKNGSVHWLSSSNLDPIITSYNLTSLSPDRDFSVRLSALPTWAGRGRWTVGEIHFRTRPATDDPTLALTLTLREVTVSETCAFLYWDPLPAHVLSQLTALHVLYKLTQEDRFTHKQRLLSKSDTHVQLVALQPDTAYTAEIAVLLATGTALTSHPVHFVTKAKHHTSAELLVAVIITSVVTVIAGVVVTLTCVLWKRSRRRGENNVFENKTYGIQLENSNEEIHVVPIVNPSVN